MADGDKENHKYAENTRAERGPPGVSAPLQRSNESVHASTEGMNVRAAVGYFDNSKSRVIIPVQGTRGNNTIAYCRRGLTLSGVACTK